MLIIEHAQITRQRCVSFLLLLQAVYIHCHLLGICHNVSSMIVMCESCHLPGICHNISSMIVMCESCHLPGIKDNGALLHTQFGLKGRGERTCLNLGPNTPPPPPNFSCWGHEWLEARFQRLLFIWFGGVSQRSSCFIKNGGEGFFELWTKIQKWERVLVIFVYVRT